MPIIQLTPVFVMRGKRLPRNVDQFCASTISLLTRESSPVPKKMTGEYRTNVSKPASAQVTRKTASRCILSRQESASVMYVTATHKEIPAMGYRKIGMV